MEGTVLGWNADKGEGVIKSESGQRYHFTSTDWKSEQKPKQNAKVDFNVNADAATEIYALGGTGQLDETLERAKAGVGQVTEKLSSNDLFRKLTEHGLYNLPSAVMVFFALLFSFGNYRSSYASLYSYADDVAVTNGFGGFVFIMAALAFIGLSIFGLRPLIVRILGGVLAVILLLHLLSIPLMVLDALELPELVDMFFYIGERLYFWQTLLLLLAFLLVVVATILPKKVNPNFATEKELAGYGTNGPSATAQNEQYVEKEQKLGYLTYALLASGPFTFLGGIAGLILAYLRRKDTDNELYKDHYRYIIRTFWFSMLWFTISLLTALIVIGIIIGFVASIWFFYRVIKGWLRLANKQMMYSK